MGSQGPRSNRACGFPAHGLPGIGRHAALCSLHPEGLLRVTDAPAQAMKAQMLEVLASPSRCLARLQVATLTRAAQGSQPSDHEAIHADELAIGIARAKVVTPAPQYGVQIRNHRADVRMAPGPRGNIFHSLPDPHHGPPIRPAMQEVQPLALLLPQPSAQALVQVTAEEVKALLAIVEIDSPRLVRV